MKLHLERGNNYYYFFPVDAICIEYTWRTIQNVQKGKNKSLPSHPQAIQFFSQRGPRLPFSCVLLREHSVNRVLAKKTLFYTLLCSESTSEVTPHQHIKICHFRMLNRKTIFKK